MILTLRTDKPEAEVGLYKDGKQLAYKTWEAHRQLSATIHATIKSVLDSQGAGWHDITGIVIFAGPGSFTGLRIGMALANTLATDIKLPIVATQGDDWIAAGLDQISSAEPGVPVLPHYGRDPHITQQKK